MKIPTAKRLPSGSWRVQVQVAGERLSVTAETEKAAIAQALAIKSGLKEKHRTPEKLTVGQAMDRYIESKDSVLSPSTIKGYRKIRSNNFQNLMEIPLFSLTQEQVQRAVNSMAKTASPKSIRNAHGLLSATLAVYRPNMVLRTTMPQKSHYEASIPELSEITSLLSASAGTVMELPILLAVWLGLRASEICGLTWDCVQGDFLRVKQAMVVGEDGPVLKGTKTFSGDRTIRLPEHIKSVLDAQPRTDEYIVHLTGQAIYKRFSRLCQRLDLPHYRFHDLRHAAASIAMSIGVPNTYTQKRMGHKTDNMLKNVYLHTLKSKEDEYATAIDNTFTALLPQK